MRISAEARAELQQDVYRLRGLGLSARQIAERLAITERQAFRLLKEPLSDIEISTDDRWMEQGACRQVDPELFFMPHGGDKTQPARARRVCNACPVQEQCQQWALDRPRLLGVWGGTTDRERNEMRRQRRRNGTA